LFATLGIGVSAYLLGPLPRLLQAGAEIRSGLRMMRKGLTFDANPDCRGVSEAIPTESATRRPKGLRSRQLHVEFRTPNPILFDEFWM
jgi:hypothetical protein